MEKIIVTVLVIVVILLLLFLILREVMCWYWKVNERITIAHQTNLLLEKIATQLGTANLVLGAANKSGITNEEIETGNNDAANVKYQRDGYALKTGSFREFIVRLANGNQRKFYQKKSNGKYFVYTKNEILLFPDKETCLDYIGDKN